MTDTAKSFNKFAFDIYARIAKGKNENVFVSPYSIATALSMCLAGAKNNTEKQLKQILNYLNLSNEEVHSLNAQLIDHLNSLSGNVALETANKIYPKNDYAIKKEFTDLVAKYYKSEVQTLNYSNASESCKIINDWVGQKTRGKISNLIPESAINSLVRLILVNAIYFKGSWLNKFDKNRTQKDKFHLIDGSEKDVDMMSILNKKFKLAINPEGLKATVCEFPYAGEQLSMTIILPHQGVNIVDVESQLNADVLKAVFLANNFAAKVHAFIPKFKFEKEFELSDVLSQLGASDAFNESKADFNGIAEDKNGLYISKVIHKAVVEVNEEGTEAAAATGVIMMTRCARIEPPPEEFKCNRPFVFVIHDNTNHTVLFIGKYTQPQ